MQANPSELKSPVKPVQGTQLELEKKVFLLKTLHETSKELEGLIQPRKILHAFLLMTMGALGITRGMIVLANLQTRDSRTVHRGFSDAEASELEKNMVSLCEQYSSDAEYLTSGTRWKIITPDHFPEKPFFSAGTEVLLTWTIDDRYGGMLALGRKISEEPYGYDDFTILENLVNILLGALSRALFTRNIQQLNVDLERKNSELKDALDREQQARQDLDKRIFHLNSLYGLSSELSGVAESSVLVETFLLISMGTFGVYRGFALVLDRSTGTVDSAARGVDRPAELSTEAAEKLIYECFDAAENRTLQPMSVTRLDAGRQHFLDLHVGFQVEESIMFVIDRSLLGVAAFSSTVSGSPFTDEEKELLSAQVAAFMVFMKNVKAFETIRTLNRGLEQTNEELRQTIVDLKEAHKKITILERAKARLGSLIISETARLNRATLLDMVVLLFAATVLGFLFNYANPNGISLLPETMFHDEVQRLDARQAMDLLQNGRAVIVDARPQEFFKRKHITEAVNVPAPLFQMLYKMKLSKLLDSDKAAIVYGRDISSRYDEVIARQLKLRNHDQVKILAGGLKDWEKEGYPVSP